MHVTQHKILSFFWICIYYLKICFHCQKWMMSTTMDKWTTWRRIWSCMYVFLDTFIISRKYTLFPSTMWRNSKTSPSSMYRVYIAPYTLYIFMLFVTAYCTPTNSISFEFQNVSCYFAACRSSRFSYMATELQATELQSARAIELQSYRATKLQSYIAYIAILLNK